AFVECFDPGAPGPAPAGVDDGAHRFRGAGEHGLDRAVAPVAHPTLDAVHRRRVLDKHAEADALDPSADDHVAHDARAHRISPVATPSAPRKPGIHRSSVAM